MERPLGVRGQERGCLPFLLLSYPFPLETPYTQAKLLLLPSPLGLT